MGQVSENYNGGILFSAAAFTAGTVGKLSELEMRQKMLDQQARQQAVKTQGVAAEANARIAADIGKEQKEQSFSQAWGEIAMGTVMGVAELANIGYSTYRSNLAEVTHPTTGLNAKIQNNQAWKSALAEPTEASIVARTRAAGVPDQPTLEAANKRLQSINPDQPLDTYPGGRQQLIDDVETIRAAGPAEVGSPLRDARKTVKNQLDENQKMKQSFDSQTEDIKGKLTRISQLLGQLGMGIGNMERGKHQELQGELEGIKALMDFINSTSQAIAQGMDKTSDQRDRNIESFNQMLTGLIQTNV
jgi:hypothetical protein